MEEVAVGVQPYKMSQTNEVTASVRNLLRANISLASNRNDSMTSVPAGAKRLSLGDGSSTTSKW